MKRKKFIIILFVFCLLMLFIFKKIKNQSERNRLEVKYDMNKTTNELSLITNEDYYKYYKQIIDMMYPEELRKYINIQDYVKSHMEALYVQQNDNGFEILDNLYSHAYGHIINLLIKNEESWTELPITENFQKKFNEQEGIIKEINDYVRTIGEFSFENKTFSVSREWIADDAYEKYTQEEIEFMLDYGAGAYNLDKYNYKFILDDNGYIDDIIFLGITPSIVEGRDVENK